jgi:hypothetical protein
MALWVIEDDAWVTILDQATGVRAEANILRHGPLTSILHAGKTIRNATKNTALALCASQNFPHEQILACGVKQADHGPPAPLLRFTEDRSSNGTMRDLVKQSKTLVQHSTRLACILQV